jgi:hypothetical protein
MCGLVLVLELVHSTERGARALPVILSGIVSLDQALLGPSVNFEDEDEFEHEDELSTCNL